MFANFLILATVAISVIAVPCQNENSCSNGSQVQCCNNLQDANSAAGVEYFKGLNLPISNPTGQFSTSCTALSVLGAAGGTSCSSQPVCCQQHNTNNGIQVVYINCSPVNVGA